VVDISAAALVAMVSISTIVFMDPSKYYSDTHNVAITGVLRETLVHVVESEGLTWFYTAPFNEECSALSGYSNSTVSVSASRGGAFCRDPPSHSIIEVRLVFPSVDQTTVVLLAWREEH
jgi:hypothetical protein